jgi:hypothetical protein
VRLRVVFANGVEKRATAPVCKKRAPRRKAGLPLRAQSQAFNLDALGLGSSPVRSLAQLPCQSVHNCQHLRAMGLEGDSHEKGCP